MHQMFEDFLQDKFHDLREIGGESLFKRWLSNMDGQEYIDFADEYRNEEVKEVLEECENEGCGNIEKIKANYLK